MAFILGTMEPTMAREVLFQDKMSLQDLAIAKTKSLDTRSLLYDNLVVIRKIPIRLVI